MKEPIESNFRAERSESLIFFSLGVIAVALAIWFWSSSRPDFDKGMAWPLLLVGAIQLTLGASVYFRSPSDAKRVWH